MKPRDIHGFTLIEVMVSLGIFMLMSLMFAGVISQMNQQMLTSSRKLETLDLKNTISGTLSYSPICSCIMNKFSSKFDPRKKDALSQVSELRTDCESDAPIVAASEMIVPGTQTQLGIKDITITKIRSRGTANDYSGVLRIRFEDDKKSMLFQNLEIPGFFTTDPSTPLNAKRIESCSFGGQGLAETAPPPGMVGFCPAGEYVSGMDSERFYCTPLPATDPVAVVARTPARATVGKGCEGHSCTTLDNGPCYGKSCKTNGTYCEGASCVAIGVGATCVGGSCCAGPHCRSKWNPGDF